MVMLALHLRLSLHYSDHLSGYRIPYLISQFVQFSSNVYKGIIDGVGWLFNNSDEPFFICGKLRHTVHGFDAPIKIFRSLELDMNLSFWCLLFCYLFCLFHFSPTRSHLYILFHFNSGEIDSQSWIRFLLVLASSLSIFTLFFLGIIIFSIFISWRSRTVRFHTVLYAAARRRMFLNGCWVLPFAQIITIGLLVLFTWNLISASVYFAIWLMPFEEV